MDHNYHENYEKSVRQIQNWLHTVSLYDADIPDVIADGTYDQQTKDAVTAFQIKYMSDYVKDGHNSDNVGKVDYETWQVLMQIATEAEEMMKSPLPIYPFSAHLKDGKLVIGDKCCLVAVVRVMFSCLGICFDEFDGFPLSDEFDSHLENDVKVFQRSAGLDETGEIDKKTWNTLACVFNKYVKERQ